MRSRRYSARCSTSRGSIPARCGRSSSASASTKCCASSRSNSRRWRARRVSICRYRALLAHRPLRPAAAAAAVAEPGVQRDQIHARRAASWSAAGAAAASCASTSTTPGSAFRRRRSKVIFREFHRLDEGAKVARGLGLGLSIVQRIGTRARSQDRPAFGARPRLALFGRGAASSAAPGPARRASCADRDRGRLLGISVLCIDNEPQGAGRHGRRCSAAGAARCSRRRISTTAIAAIDRVAGRARTVCWSTITSTAATASMPSPSCAAFRRRIAGDPDHRRPLAACARRGARARRPGAEQAAQARGAARADGAMARAAGGGGGIAPLLSLGDGRA